MLTQALHQKRMKTISLIGAPTDVGASVRGAGMGPDALRVAGLNEALTARGLKVIDHGNLHGPANPWEQPVNGLRHLKEAIDWNQAVYDAVDKALQDGHMPMMLGGDHCLAIGSISAVAAHCRRVGKKLRVLWFDAPCRQQSVDHQPYRQYPWYACRLPHGSWS